MRYYKKAQIVLSEDTSSEPKEIRFSAERTLSELVQLKDVGGSTKTYSIGTHAIDLGQVAEGRWIYIESDKAITISINAGPAIELLPNLPSEMWVKYTSLSLTTTELSRISVGVAGE